MRNLNRVLLDARANPRLWFLQPYSNVPRHERAVWKDIPIEFIDDVQGYLNAIAPLPRGKRYSYRYRGPRRPDYIGGMNCLKEDANRFSVYIDNDSRYWGA